MSDIPKSDFTQLSPEAQALFHRMRDQGCDPWEIRRGIQRTTGERVMLQVITGRTATYAEWQQQGRRARTGTDHFIRLLGKKGVKVSELLRAVLIEKLSELQRKRKFTKPDLYKLDDAERKRREFELKQTQTRASTRQKKKEFELKEREMQLDEQRFALDRDKLQATIQKLEGKAQAGEPLSPGDIRRIREIYGLEDPGPGDSEAAQAKEISLGRGERAHSDPMAGDDGEEAAPFVSGLKRNQRNFGKL